MGWSIGYDTRWGRDIGYGVPSTCDYPECGAKIDRGLGYVCGAEHYGGEDGCGLFFCEHHLQGDGLCKRCARGNAPFTPKPDHPEWIDFKRTDASWAKWRETQGGNP